MSTPSSRSTKLTGAPYAEHWAYNPHEALYWSAYTQSVFIFFFSLGKYQALRVLQLWRAARDKPGGAWEGRKNPGNVVSIAGIKTAGVIISSSVAVVHPNRWVVALLDCVCICSQTSQMILTTKWGRLASGHVGYRNSQPSWIPISGTYTSLA